MGCWSSASIGIPKLRPHVRRPHTVAANPNTSMESMPPTCQKIFQSAGLESKSLGSFRDHLKLKLYSTFVHPSPWTRRGPRNRPCHPTVCGIQLFRDWRLQLAMAPLSGRRTHDPIGWTKKKINARHTPNTSLSLSSCWFCLHTKSVWFTMSQRSSLDHMCAPHIVAANPISYIKSMPPTCKKSFQSAGPESKSLGSLHDRAPY